MPPAIPVYNQTNMRGRTAARRISLILFLMCAVACVQAASIASEQFHQHSSQHCCGLCHTGPLAFIQTAMAAALAPILSQAWLDQTPRTDSPHQVLLAAASSRAPPA
jgi:hypothetical protein